MLRARHIEHTLAIPALVASHAVRARHVERGLAVLALMLATRHPMLKCRELLVDEIPVLEGAWRIAGW
jgi:hypothetical protein